jgi:hypothetical protein
MMPGAVFDKDSVVVVVGSRMLIMLTEARECPACHTMHYWFVNANGRTTCSGCAPEKREA